MSNDYYNYNNDLTPGSRARSEEIDAQFTAIAAAFDKLAGADALKVGAHVGGDDTGSADTYVVDTGADATPVDYQMVVFKPSANNTGAATLAANDGSAYAIKRNNGDDLEADDLIAGIPYLVIYDADNTRWVLVGATYQQTQAALRPGVSTETGTSYTLTSADEGSIIQFSNGSAVTVTIPANATTALPVGYIVHLHQVGSGQVTVSAASGVTLSNAISAATRTQYSSLSLIKVATNTWRLIGDADPS